MKVKVFMAQTVNAKIARETGEEDFLSSRNWQEFKKIAEKVGAFAFGRKTYEAVKQWEEKGFKDIEAERIILSRKEDFIPENGFIKASGPEKAIEIAQEHGFDTLLVTGGASVNRSFIEESLVDELILNVEPYILGEGLNLIEESSFELDLEFEKMRELDQGIVQLRYRL